MKLHVDPEQIQALNDGEEIVVLVRMEPQPESGAKMDQLSDGSWAEMAFNWPHRRRFWKCPVAAGDTVELRCKLCGSDGAVTRCFACEELPLRPTVRHIAHREQDGHCWEVRLG